MNNTLERSQVNSVYHGTELLSFLAPKIWGLVPLELKKVTSTAKVFFAIK